MTTAQEFRIHGMIWIAASCLAPLPFAGALMLAWGAILFFGAWWLR